MTDRATPAQLLGYDPFLFPTEELKLKAWLELVLKSTQFLIVTHDDPQQRQFAAGFIRQNCRSRTVHIEGRFADRKWGMAICSAYGIPATRFDSGQAICTALDAFARSTDVLLFENCHEFPASFLDHSIDLYNAGHRELEDLTWRGVVLVGDRKRFLRLVDRCKSGRICSRFLTYAGE